jgi:hypothetical protein
VEALVEALVEQGALVALVVLQEALVVLQETLVEPEALVVLQETLVAVQETLVEQGALVAQEARAEQEARVVLQEALVAMVAMVTMRKMISCHPVAVLVLKGMNKALMAGRLTMTFWTTWPTGTSPLVWDLMPRPTALTIRKVLAMPRFLCVPWLGPELLRWLLYPSFICSSLNASYIQ